MNINKQQNKIVIGAAGGLGSSIVTNCLENGDIVYAIVKPVVNPNKAKLSERDNLFVYESNISEYESTNKVIKNIYNIAGSIQHIYICTGIKICGENIDYWDSIRETLDVNLLAVINCIKSILEFCDQRELVKIIVVSSMGDKHGMIETHGYNASKAALSILCESIQYDLWSSESKVCLQIVRPGFIRTLMNSNSLFANVMSISQDKASKNILKKSSGTSFYNSFPLIMNIFTIILSSMPVRLKYLILKRLNNDKRK